MRSRALAELIERDLASGKVDEYARRREVELAALPDEVCRFCTGAGVRDDEVGRTHGYDKPRDPATGLGGCNGCNGAGSTPAMERHYAFDVENVREFAEFLRGCGGFGIY